MPGHRAAIQVVRVETPRSERLLQRSVVAVEEQALAGHPHLQVALVVAREQKDRQQEQVRMEVEREELVPLRQA